jgi:hypothetical protein
VGELNKAGINLKIPNPMQECPVKHLCTSRPAGEKSTDQYASVEENNKRYQEKPQLYRTRQR